MRVITLRPSSIRPHSWQVQKHEKTQGVKSSPSFTKKTVKNGEKSLGIFHTLQHARSRWTHAAATRAQLRIEVDSNYQKRNSTKIDFPKNHLHSKKGVIALQKGWLPSPPKPFPRACRTRNDCRKLHGGTFDQLFSPTIENCIEELTPRNEPNQR